MSDALNLWAVQLFGLAVNGVAWRHLHQAVRRDKRVELRLPPNLDDAAIHMAVRPADIEVGANYGRAILRRAADIGPLAHDATP